MNLFSILKRLVQNDADVLPHDGNEYVPSFWEDDYGQIEIVRIENKESILQQFKKISAVTKDGEGFTEMFVRDVHTAAILEQEIRADYVEYTLTRYRFQKAKHIYFDGRKLLDCSSGNTKAFGFPEFTIFFDIEEDFVKEFWLVMDKINSKERINLIAEALFELAECFDLDIVDWNRLEIVDLSDVVLIKRYLRSYP